MTLDCFLRNSRLLLTVFLALLNNRCCSGQQTTSGSTSAQETAVADTFVFSVDLLEGATGYYNVEGYDGVQPVLTMIR